MELIYLSKKYQQASVDNHSEPDQTVNKRARETAERTLKMCSQELEPREHPVLLSFWGEQYLYELPLGG